MWWTDPVWLLALTSLVPIIGLGARRRDAKADPAADTNARPAVTSVLRRLTGLRAVSLTLAVLALAGTSVMLPTHGRRVAVLLDVSASVGRAQVEQARRAARNVMESMASNGLVAVIAFAGRPRVVTSLAAPSEAAALLEADDLTTPEPEATDLEAALRTGVELLGRHHGSRRMLLFSDGRANAGAGTIADLVALGGGVPVDVVPIGRQEAGLTSEALILPESARPGERIIASWKVRSDQARTAIVTMIVDGKMVERGSVSVPAGISTVPLAMTAPAPGFHRVTLEAVDDGGRPWDEATVAGLLQVAGPARILVVRGPGSSPIGTVLETQGFHAEATEAAAMPGSVTGLGRYAAVVLDDVPAVHLAAEQRRALVDYVTGGGGLLVVGGEHSLGRGEYYATELEDLLPVHTDTRQRLFFTRANILFVIDRSGSMSEDVGRTSKQEAAMRGIAAAVKDLDPQDEVAVLSFDTEPTWVLPFTSVTRREEIQRALAGIGGGGGTDLSTALREAAEGFADRGPVRRHVVILTDGLTEGERFEELCRRLRDTGATITTIAVGEQVNEELLRSIATWGQGQYYRAKMDQIPQVMLKETVRITRDLIQEGRFSAAVHTSADLLRGIGGETPPILGYLITKPKHLATVYLTVGKGDPLLAVWRYGDGLVAVFAGDSGRRWLAPWVDRPVYNRLWSQVVRYVERRTADTDLRASARLEAGVARIVVEATDPERRLQPGLQLVGRAVGTGASFQLTETAPGRYEASLPSPGGGLQEYEIHDRGGSWTLAAVWNPPGGEHQARGPDPVLLAQLCAGTGGRLLSLDGLALPAPRWAWGAVPLRGWLIVLALLLFVLELGYRSTSLGQVAMAREALAVWWGRQRRMLDQARGLGRREAPEAGWSSRRAIESHRFLAESAGKRKRQKMTGDTDG